MSDFTPADLPRVSERIPYLYLEQCVIKRANNALVAADENGENRIAYRYHRGTHARARHNHHT